MIARADDELTESRTVSAQISAIDERHRNNVLEKIFKTKKPKKTNLRRSSTFFIPELSYLSKRKIP